MNKMCSKCLVEKNLSDFYKDKSKADGYYHQCKSCKNCRRKVVEKNKRREDPYFRFKTNFNKRLINALLKNKDNYIFKNLPYSKLELIEYLEKLFEPWMSWDNMGSYNVDGWDDSNPITWKWQIDHILPQSAFPYSDYNDNNFIKVWNLKNLRPLNAKENLLKGNKI